MGELGRREFLKRAGYGAGCAAARVAHETDKHGHIHCQDRT